MNKRAAIAIFAYNRPACFIETLEALKSNKEIIESEVYIFCDGARENASAVEIERIKEVRQIAKSIDWCKKLIVIENKVNKGLGNSIISGVSRVLEENEKIIVMEDDLVVSEYFLEFLNDSLDLYENNEEVISISGYNYPIPFNANFPETMFLRGAECLGWGTWKRGWKLFNENANLLHQIIVDNSELTLFNFNNNYPYSKLLLKVAMQESNSWAVRWYASAFVNNKLTFYPKKSLVRHIGNEGGTNVKIDDKNLLGWEISEKKTKIRGIPVTENSEFRNLLIAHLRKFNRKRITLSSISYVFKKILLVIKKSFKK